MDLPSPSVHLPSHSEPLTQPPVLSTPETHIFEDPTPPSTSLPIERYTDEQIWEIYEIKRTAREIVDGKWRRVALQFPDTMLRDGTRVSEALERELTRLEEKEMSGEKKRVPEGKVELRGRIRLYILADTSYNACCVDEIAAEHADAEVVVHYGRSCLSPTARLPVIYVFTTHPLDLDAVVSGFESVFLKSSKSKGGDAQSDESKEQKIILMADITYHNHVSSLAERLRADGWTNILVPEITHDPESVIPNRKVPDEMEENELRDYKLFHISEPPNALVMILYARVGEFVVYPTTSIAESSITKPEILTNTKQLLNRRYALLSHLQSAPILGILVNTLSHSSTTSVLQSLTALLRKHGKKYYTFVVGKVNAAKMANFSEIGGWVVVGCWEGGLFDEGGFWRGTVTPFELDLALKGEGWKVRGGEWRSGPVLASSIENDHGTGQTESEKEVLDGTSSKIEQSETSNLDGDDDSDSLSESEPPEYDFRTGQYITSSHARSSRKAQVSATSTAESSSSPTSSKALARRSKNTDLATVNGVLSPGAEYMRSQRTWQGLGSDFVTGGQEGSASTIEEGRRGVARGYVVGDGGEAEQKH